MINPENNWLRVKAILKIPRASGVPEFGYRGRFGSGPARQTGDPKAKVVIVEYSDFQCPSCATLHPVVNKL